MRDRYEVAERHHACAILKTDFPNEWNDLIEVLLLFRLRKSAILEPGKNKSLISKGINGYFAERGWVEKAFEIEIKADGEIVLAPTHHIDYFKGQTAVETEWSNKDPFFDRDLTTFRLLFELNVLSVGVIITKSWELQKLFNELGKGKSYGKSTTHMATLIPKMENRASGGCPVLAFGMTRKLYDPDS